MHMHARRAAACMLSACRKYTCSVTERSRTGPEILVRGTNSPRKFGPGGGDCFPLMDQISMVYITIHAIMTISDTAVQAMIRNQCEV